MIIICDIDGTIADCSHRLSLILEKPKNWDEFHRKCVDDKVVENVRQILISLVGTFSNHQVIYITGRPNKSGNDTYEWLMRHRFPQAPLYMRRDDDYREDYVIKSEMLDKYLLMHSLTVADVLCALEDRDQVCAMWRERGITCLQVKKGDY